jgi:predicted amidohydrolase
MTSKKLVVAAIQISSTSDIQRNIELAEMLIDQAVDEGAQLVLLPENFAQIPSSKIKRQQAYEAIGSGPIQEFLATKSEQKSIYLVAGSVAIASEHSHKAFSASLCFDPNGDLLARYNKIHLFDVRLPGGKNYAESDSFEYGELSSNGGLFSTPWGTFCLTICYDLRFPELFRQVIDQDIIGYLVPAAFTYDTGAAHWETLLRARAIENLSFVIASNQVGVHPNGLKSWGHSMVLDPWGTILGQQEIGEGAVLATLDISRQRELRREFPCLKHRRIK